MVPKEIDALLPKKNSLRLQKEDTEQSLEANQQSTGRKILDLAIPAGAALLIDPLMTLADTAFVGRFADSPVELAGMGSAVPILTFSFYLFNFLCTATTPLVASRRAAGKPKDAAAVGAQALTLSLVLGATLTITLLSLKQTLLIVMGTGITGELANKYALAFLSVRALAAPAVLCIEASTGVLRGYLDTRTPIVILIVANLLNLALDIVLIAFAGLGPMGAAIATTTAEWVSALLFLGVLSGTIPSASSSVEAVEIRPSLSIPTWQEVRPLIVASASVFFRAVVLQVSLSGAAAMAARSVSDEAAVAVAAHQIGIQLWILCSFFCDSLAAASQGLVADALGRKDPDGVREVSKTVFAYSLCLGLFLGLLLQAGEATGLLFEIFTDDNSIQGALHKILPLIVIAQPLNAMVFAADGVLQGASEFTFQAKAMALSGLTALSTFAWLEMGNADVATLVHVWTALIALQSMRGLTSLWKVAQKDGPINIFG
ncbi:hypothetical protein FisN_4Lh494 [Fistulifera solaris]|uniref:Multidrug resistance protein, MATE family n=1 Tax=Fistulifera solaris TaxID=1519565 RepID=A0A1Z5KDP1_FISSO|nr:hypothetical protein FisN_4Lh494 [Fistulifera solaris]|eukprot:GAX24369.1 hypothetical protein FisN_4Lh494 [Fistulifera solaris]